MTCSKCHAKVKEVYPLGGERYCGQCVPAEYRRTYKDWKPEKKVHQ